MVKIYNYQKDKDKKLSDHFAVGEFRSHANGTLTTDTILIDELLVTKLEALMANLGATKAVITSGYRDYKCDKLVGGSGRGKHVEGMAADVIFYKGTKTIDTKLVSCRAQDEGFGGIARINDRAIHLDTRQGARYLGDETKSKNTVTKDFYDYYNMKRPVKKYRDEVKKRFGFDKSTIDFLEGHPYPEDLFEKLATRK